MKFKKSWLYVTAILGGIGYVAQNLQKRRQMRWWRIFVGVLIGVIMIVSYAIGQVFVKADSYFTQKIEGCAVVFGAAVWRNDQPSWALSDRVQASIDLYEAGQVNCLVLSGGASTYGDHEVDVMRRLAQEAGIASSRLYLDYNGFNTLATISNLPRNQSTFVFVSNDFHLARIGLIAQKKGIENFALHAAPYQKGRYVKNDEYFLREIAGYLLIFFGLKS